jgi:hypothetical protein
MGSEKTKSGLRYLAYSVVSFIGFIVCATTFQLLDKLVPPGTGNAHVPLVIFLLIIIWTMLMSLVASIGCLAVSVTCFIRSLF